MKTYNRLAVVLVAGYCLLQAGQAWADIVNEYYSDGSTLYFNGYPDNYGDTINSNLDISGMVVTFDNVTGRLLGVTIESQYQFPESQIPASGFDSLFINVNNSGTSYQTWDYLVHSGGSDEAAYAAGGTLPGDGLWKVLDRNNYTYTLVAPGEPDARVGHPNGIAAESLDATKLGDPLISFGEGVPIANGNAIGYTMTYDFSNLVGNSGVYLIPENGTFSYAIGWTSYSANDVTLASGKSPQQPAPPAVPEPATMVLFGVGIAALTGWRKRKKNIEG